MNCLFCDNHELEEFKIKEYNYWIVDLSINQCFLGRCTIRLKRHLEDFFDINEEELKEFFEITRKVRNVIKEVFGADMFNYATLGNLVRHVHLHLISRYSKKVHFEGYTFKNTGWGKHYRLHQKDDFKIPKEIQMAIKDRIKEKLL